jgi:predicted amidohydrolase
MQTRKLTVGMGQLLVEGGEPERNLERVERMAAQAVDEGCDLLLLPECLDLAWTHPSCFNEAKPIPSPQSDNIAAVAKKHGLFICCGLTEKDGDRVYNTAILTNDQGEILLKYRKINVLDVALPMYAVGDRLGVVDTKFGRIGLNICSDNYDDALDIGFVLGRMGAQLILSPSSWTVDYSLTEIEDPYGEKWLKPYTTLAKAFDLVVVNATSVGTIVGGPYEGKKMVGCSLAVNKDGVLKQGKYNEFAGELVVVAFDVPAPSVRGADISVGLKAAGLLAGQS